MAIAKKCDRCGNYYDANTKYNGTLSSLCTGHICGLYTLNSRGFDYEQEEHIRYDLCDKCLESFYDWLEGENAADD